MSGSKSLILGIDLGTSNSLVGYWRNGATHLVPNALGSNLTPSCVSLDDDGSILVGAPAADRLRTHPDRSASVFKRTMGSARGFRLGDRHFLPEELSSFVLRALKDDAIAHLGGGTFDVSVREQFDGVIDVRASAGNNFLGGEDFRRLYIRARHA